MRDYSKTGGKKGKPGYRTPSSFIKRRIKDERIKPQKEKFKRLPLK